MYLEEFAQKDVVCVRNLRKLGKVIDLEFDECTGCICRFLVREKPRLRNLLCPAEEFSVPFCKIKQIGPDIILVDM